MPESVSPSVRIHRVTTRRHSLRALQCPLEPELLVAEFADELPPDVTIAVREHVALCEICGARSRALQEPYKLLATLGNEPVAYVPDLRDNVRAQARKQRVFQSMIRISGNLGRGWAVAVIGIVGIALVVSLILGGVFFSAYAQQVTRSVNTLHGVPMAASGGTLYAETNKLVTVTDSSGNSWRVAEIIAVSERTGVITNSLPASNDSVQVAQSSQAPVGVAVTADGMTVVEVTAPDDAHRQALVGFRTADGSLRFITPLSVPAGQMADALTLSPDGMTAYVGVSDARPAVGGTRILVLNALSGALQHAYAPSFMPTKIPMSPAPGSLPVSLFPTLAPILDATAMTARLGAGGELAISPDGQWLYDALTLTDAQGKQYAVVRRINAFTGRTDQELALPGNFSLAHLAADNNEALPQIYLVTGAPNAQCFVLDASATGPTQLGDITLGGPPASPTTIFTGSLTISPSADGTRVYIAQNVATAAGSITGHDLWLLDTQNMVSLTHTSDTDAADAALAASVNANGTADHVFELRNGEVSLISGDLSGTATAWLSLTNGQVTRLITTVR